MKVLSEEEKHLCSGQMLSEDECKEALREMKNNKSPGSDGITTEFYKIFWNDIKKYLINSINYSYLNNSLTELQKQSIITLIPKSDKDTKYLENWRPVSLLNTDYKIATKAIANKIKRVLPGIIDFSQAGFIKGRNISDNIRILLETFEHLETEPDRKSVV